MKVHMPKKPYNSQQQSDWKQYQPQKQKTKVTVRDGIISNSLSSCFSLAHLNVRSLVNKLDQLKIILSKAPFDILCLNETFCDGSISDEEIKLPGYEIIRKDIETAMVVEWQCIFVVI